MNRSAMALPLDSTLSPRELPLEGLNVYCKAPRALLPQTVQDDPRRIGTRDWPLSHPHLNAARNTFAHLFVLSA